MSDPADKARAEVAGFLDLVADHLRDENAGPSARAARVASRYHPTEAGVAPLIVRARECPVAFDACVSLFDHLIQNDQPIPDNLLLMARDAMGGRIKRPAKRGRDGMKNWGRDSAILTAIGIAREHDVALYAHGNDTHGTVCTIVADALAEHGVHLSRDAVESVWQKHHGGKK